MAETPWYNLLPTAPDIANGTQKAQAGFAAARGASTAANKAAYDLDLQKTVEALMSASIGDNGLDQDKFYRLASGTPYGVSAIKAYADTAFPQMQKQAIEQGGAAKTGEQADSMIANNQNFAQSTRAGTAAALTGPTSPLATELGAVKQRSLLGAYGVPQDQQQHWSQQSPTNPYQMAMNAQPNIGSASIASKPIDEFNAANLPPQQQAQLAQSLKSMGGDLYASNDPRSLSAGATEAVQRAIDAKRAEASAMVLDKDGNPNPLETQRNIKAFEGTVPALAQAEYAKLLASGREATGANLGQKGSAQSIGITAKTISNADDFNRRGFDGVTGANVEKAQALQGEVEKVHSSAVMAKSLADNPTKVEKMTPDQFGEEVFNALKGIKTAEGVATISADDNLSAFFRPGASVGKVLAQSEGPSDFVKGVLRSNLSKTERVQLLRDIQMMAETAEKGGIARSAMTGAYGAGKMPWEVEHWSKQKPGAATGAPKAGDENANGEIWTGKRWAK